MSRVKAITKKYTIEEWTKIIQSQLDSDKSVNEYCEEKGISKSAYYYYFSKVNEKIKAESTGNKNQIDV